MVEMAWIQCHWLSEMGVMGELFISDRAKWVDVSMCLLLEEYMRNMEVITAISEKKSMTTCNLVCIKTFFWILLNTLLCCGSREEWSK